MSVLQPALHSASVTPSLPLTAAQCSAVCPFCNDEGVVASERCSHAAVLSVPSIKHTDRRRGKEPRHKVYSAQDNNTNSMYIYYCLYRKLLMPHDAMQTDASIRPYVHTHTHYAHTRAISHTNTHTHVCTSAYKNANIRQQICPQTEKNTSNTHTITSFRKSGSQPNCAS
jgi:hypothetical protein